ncbi:unnamed protein product, partial [Mesorhabditis spiculigera]
MMTKFQSPPPDPIQAETSIAQHMQTLLSTQDRRARRTQALPQGPYSQLPVTKYAPDGQISDAYWGREPSNSPNISTMSLLNTSTIPKNRTLGHDGIIFNRAGSSLRRRSSLRTSQNINGLFSRSSTTPAKGMPRQKNLNAKPLFSLNDFYSEAQLDDPFLGREWVFREIYEHSVVEGVPILYVEGGRGAGKSAIANQIIMHSPFYKRQTSDTLDSGCEADAPHYEWLRAVAARLVAYHVCSIQDAATCSIPEFVCNLGATLAHSPILLSYADILTKNPGLQNLLTLDNCLKFGPQHVFEKAIVDPLAQLSSSDQGCLVILIDGLDEAEFHRSEAGMSIARFLESVYGMLPAWIRLILTVDYEAPTRLEGHLSASVRIDDTQLDERAMRDSRMLAEYRVSGCHLLEEGLKTLKFTSGDNPLSEFISRIVAQSCGNMMYIALLLSLAESNVIRLKALASALLPADLDELYLLYFNLTFSSTAIFTRCSQILSLLIASLQSLTPEQVAEILNDASPKPLDLTPEEVLERVELMSPFVVLSSMGRLSLKHSSFREWLLRSQGQCRYTVDAREGHLLLAIWLTRKKRLDSSKLFDLAHHLLKANPHKYFNNRPVPEISISRECQVNWLEYAAENIGGALLYDRNLLYPNSKVSRLLLLSGASADACREEDGMSLLSLAARHGDPSVVSLLLQFGAQVIPSKGELPVVAASKAGQLDVVQILHQHGALQGDSALLAIIAAAEGGHPQVVSFLLECDWHDAEAKEVARQAALEKAASTGSVSVCEYLLDGVCEKTLSLDSAMRAACLGGSAEVVQFLLSRGAVLSTLSWPEDRSALSCAVESGSWDLVTAVLNQPNCEIDRQDKQGQTALHLAGQRGHVGLIDLLLRKGANQSLSDLEGNTALMMAIKNNHAACAQLFLERGIDVVHLQNIDGQSAIHVACASASRPIVESILDAGGKIEEKDAEGNHPIETAIKARNDGAIAALLRRGARLRSVTWTVSKQFYPRALLVLLRKLLDDAGLLYRKRKTEDAIHRLNYALEKCDQMLEDDTGEEQGEELRVFRWQILLGLARAKRRQGYHTEAIRLSSEAAILADTDDKLSEVLFFRAKCHFDNQDLERARYDAMAAAQLKPMEEEHKMVWRHAVKVALAAGEALAKGFSKAVKEELKATQQASAAQAAKGGHSKTEAQENMAANARLGISLDESMQILNVKAPLDQKQVEEQYERLFALNDKTKGGSFYLQSKVYRAKERIDEEFRKTETTKASKPPSSEAPTA